MLKSYVVPPNLRKVSCARRTTHTLFAAASFDGVYLERSRKTQGEL